MKNLFSFLVFILVFNLYSQNSGIYKIVGISKYESLKFYSKPDFFSSIIGTINDYSAELKTTWKTDIDKNKNYWIELKYNDITGWVNRANVTLANFSYKINDEQLKSIVFDIATTFQLGKKEFIEKYISGIRGIYFYSNKINNTMFYTKDDFLSNVKFLTLKNYNDGNNISYFINSFNSFVEKKFEIHNEIRNDIEELPVELKNFYCFMLTQKNKRIYIGLEVWNEKLYVSYIAYFG